VEEEKGPVRPIGSISVLAIVGTLALTGTASASTLAVNGGILRFDAAKGEANNVDLRDGGGQTTVTDSGSIIHAGNGCTQVTPHQASCPLPGGFGDQDVVMTLADRNDAARAFKVSFGHIAIDGGAGNDTISDSPQSGADVDGGLGDDTITVHPNFGGSVDVHGGLGRDSITAASASGTVDGGVGDDDITLHTFLNPAFSAAYGGPGDDTITADLDTNMGLIDGGLGDDRISTGPQAVVAQLTGGFGDDRIVSQNGASTINGGFGRDFIDGHDEGDTIDCGSGIDRYVQYAGDTVSNCEVPQA
jgi:Ca2+-binding RTX toxin-like protein